ncbi:FtsX-like permease family protein [Nonomuraea roseola]|uniref:FtsX-like permease family protein n=1 Tax=Nonomuraea roseola TaxID=46179 RepID=A0ABV5PZ58_9ACTN
MRALLRISRRDALRAKGRTVLIMVMIGLPVLVITGVLTLAATADVTLSEGIVRKLGAADLRIKTSDYARVDEQYGDFGMPHGEGAARPKNAAATTAAEVAARLQPGSRLIGFDEGSVDVRTGRGYDHVSAIEIDLRDPLTKGMRPLIEGRYPAAADEVAVTPRMGRGPGDTIEVTRADRRVTVVGVVEFPFDSEYKQVVGFRGVLLKDKRDGRGTGWLADTPAPATWEDTRSLNEMGLIGLSPASLAREPAISMETTTVVGIGVAVFMVGMETVLLAGPAFAIGLRRRATELAVIAAQGGSKAHLRMIVLADGLVMGGAAALVAAVAGVSGGLLLVPVLSDSVGPLEVPWWPVVGVMALGLVSGVAAAMAPAVLVGRQDPAAVLAGRSGAARGGPGRPVLGLVLVVAGVVATLLASRTQEVWIFAAAVLGLLGLVALVPLLVALTGRLAVRLPLAPRLGVRDAVRHRMRTASAVAAVMAATAGAVAAGIGVNSQYVEARESFRSLTPIGTLSIGAREVDDAEWARIRQAAQERLPGVQPVEGFVPVTSRGRTIALLPECTSCGPTGYNLSEVLVGDQRLLSLMQGGNDPRAAAALAEGKAVVFDPSMVRHGRLSLRAGFEGPSSDAGKFEVPAVVAKAADPRVIGILLSPAAMKAKGFTLKERLIFARHWPQDVEVLRKDLQAASVQVSVHLEDGFQTDIASLLLVLMGGALILVLGGTFVATALAAADLRPDLATISAVGAPSRTGRLVLAGQAGYIAGLGALVGAIAGAVPGVALAWAMTSRTGYYVTLNPEGLADRIEATTVAVPWELVGAIVVGLPLLAALVAGAFARTRALPLTRRLT